VLAADGTTPLPNLPVTLSITSLIIAAPSRPMRIVQGRFSSWGSSGVVTLLAQNPATGAIAAGNGEVNVMVSR